LGDPAIDEQFKAGDVASRPLIRRLKVQLSFKAGDYASAGFWNATSEGCLPYAVKMDAWIIFMRHASLHAGSRQQLDRLKPSPARRREALSDVRWSE